MKPELPEDLALHFHINSVYLVLTVLTIAQTAKRPSSAVRLSNYYSIKFSIVLEIIIKGLGASCYIMWFWLYRYYNYIDVVPINISEVWLAIARGLAILDCCGYYIFWVRLAIAHTACDFALLVFTYTYDSVHYADSATHSLWQ